MGGTSGTPMSEKAAPTPPQVESGTAMWQCGMDPGPDHVPSASGYGDEGQPLRDFDHDLRETLVTYIEVGVECMQTLWRV